MEFNHNTNVVSISSENLWEKAVFVIPGPSLSPQTGNGQVNARTKRLHHPEERLTESRTGVI